MKLFVTAVLAFVLHGLYAQSPPARRELDSLKNKLQHELSHRDQVLTWGRLAGVYTGIAQDSADLAIKKAAGLCKRPEEDTLLTRLYIAYSRDLLNQGKGELSYPYLIRARKISALFPAPSRYAYDAATALSDHYNRRQHGDSALYYDLQKLRHSKDTLEKIAALKNVGVSYNNVGNTTRALEHYLLALRLLDRYKHPAQHAGVLTNLGVLYEDDGDNARAEQYLKQALEIHRQAGNTAGRIRVLINLGIVYDHEDRPEDALKCYDEAEGLMTVDTPPIQRKIVTLNSGASLVHAGQAEEGLKKFDQAMEGFKMLNDSYGVILTHRHIGEALYHLNRLAQAEQRELLTLKLAAQHDFFDLENQACFDLFHIYEKAGQYKKAFEYQKRYQHIEDSLNSQQRRSKLGLLEKDYEIAHKNDENQALQQENEIQKIQADADRTTRIALSSTLGFIVLLAIVATWGYYRVKNKNNLLAQQKAKIEASNTLITRQAKQLEEASQAKSKFFANVSHELRTPVTLISGMLEILQENTPAGKSNDMAQIALSNSQRLQSLVNEVLDLSRLEADRIVLQKKTTALLPLLTKLVYAFESLLSKKGIHLEYEAAALNDIHLALDEDKFEKIINNLMYNALKFNHEGGWVKVEGDLSPARDSVMIRISDSGIGIPAADLPHIFERFYQSNGSSRKHTEGIGIGLSLVSEFTALHGGHVSVVSKVNEGAAFTLRFPITPEDAAATASPQAPEPELPADGLTVDGYTGHPTLLIVEDNDEMRLYLREIFKDKATIHEAPHGAEALRWLANHTPDIIISDVMMPVMDGYEFIGHLKNSHTLKHIPVVVLTARASEEDKLYGLSLGVDDYVAKPFSSKELAARVRNLLANQTVRRQWKEKTLETGEQPETETDTENKIFLQDVETFVTSHVHDASFGIGHLADHLAMSERQLYRKCGVLTGMTPAQVVKDIRLQIAYRLLTERKFTKVSALAAQVGFENSAYFSKQFFEKFGKKPVDML